MLSALLLLVSAFAGPPADTLCGVTIDSEFVPDKTWQASLNGTWVRPCSVVSTLGQAMVTLCGSRVAQITWSITSTNHPGVLGPEPTPDPGLVFNLEPTAYSTGYTLNQIREGLVNAGWVLVERDQGSPGDKTDFYQRGAFLRGLFYGPRYSLSPYDSYFVGLTAVSRQVCTSGL